MSKTQVPPRRTINAAMAAAVEAEQRCARAARKVDRASRPSVSPAARLIIEQSAAIERRIGISAEAQNFQGAERRICTPTEDQQENQEAQWAIQTRIIHAAISAIGARLDTCEARLEVVLATPVPSAVRPATAVIPLTHAPVTPLQSQQAEIIGRLDAIVEQFDILLARINL